MNEPDQLLPDQQSDEFVILHRRKSKRAYWLECLRHFKRLPLADWDVNSYVFTNKRIFCTKNGQTDQLSFEKITNASFGIPNLVANLFNFGYVLVEATDRQSLLIEEVDEPEKVQLAVFDGLARAAAAQAGIQYHTYRQIVEMDLASKETLFVYRKHPWFLFRAVAIPIFTLMITGVLLLFNIRYNLWDRLIFGFPGLVGLTSGFLSIWVIVCLFWLWFRVENWRNDKLILSSDSIQISNALPLGLFESRRQVTLLNVYRILTTEETPREFDWKPGSISIVTTGGSLLDYANIPFAGRCSDALHSILYDWVLRRLETAENQDLPYERGFALNRFLETIDRQWIEDLKIDIRTLQPSTTYKIPLEFLDKSWTFDLASTWFAQRPVSVLLLRNRLGQLQLSSRFVQAAQIGVMQWDTLGHLTTKWIECQSSDDTVELPLTSETSMRVAHNHR